MKQTIDIEELLVWAYRDQCVDRMAEQMKAAIAPPSMPGVGSGQTMWLLGTRIDQSGHQLAWIGAKAPDDALVVHDAVLALADHWIEVDGSEVAIWRRDEIEALGWALKETARGWMLLKPDPRSIDLVADHPVKRSVATVIVMQHARSASRPDVYADWSRPVGRPRRGSTEEADVIYARAVYCAWHAALDVLAEELAGALENFDVRPPLAPETPWDVPRRVVRSVPADKIVIRPKRLREKRKRK